MRRGRAQARRHDPSREPKRSGAVRVACQGHLLQAQHQAERRRRAWKRRQDRGARRRLVGVLEPAEEAIQHGNEIGRPEWARRELLAHGPLVAAAAEPREAQSAAVLARRDRLGRLAPHADAIGRSRAIARELDRARLPLAHRPGARVVEHPRGHHHGPRELRPQCVELRLALDLAEARDERLEKRRRPGRAGRRRTQLVRRRLAGRARQREGDRERAPQEGAAASRACATLAGACSKITARSYHRPSATTVR